MNNMIVNMNKKDMNIQSDFTDYYDSVCNNSYDSIMIYNRFRNQSMQRGKAMQLLHRNGIRTVEFGRVDEFDNNDKIVVYMDPSKHECKSKMIMQAGEAKIIYSNMLASKFYECKYSIRVLNIGEKMFRILMRNEIDSISNGRIVDVCEIGNGFNYIIQEPICSIDYLNTKSGMLAVDLNQVQQLECMKYNDEYLLSSKEVVDEIAKAMLAYNKI